MIPFWSFAPPAVMPVRFPEPPSPLEKFGEFLAAQFHQIRADWDGRPEIAEQIERIVGIQ